MHSILQSIVHDLDNQRPSKSLSRQPLRRPCCQLSPCRLPQSVTMHAAYHSPLEIHNGVRTGNFRRKVAFDVARVLINFSNFSVIV